MKRFKSRKPKKRKKLWLIIFAFFFVFSYVFMIQYLSKNKLKNNVLYIINSDLPFTFKFDVNFKLYSCK